MVLFTLELMLSYTDKSVKLVGITHSERNTTVVNHCMTH